MHNRILCKDCPNAQSALETVKRMLPKLKIVSTLPKLSHHFVTSEERLLCNLVRSVLTHTWHTRDGGGQHKARHGCNLEADAPSTHPGHQCRGKKPVAGKNPTFVHQPNAGLRAGLEAIILSSPASRVPIKSKSELCQSQDQNITSQFFHVVSWYYRSWVTLVQKSSYQGVKLLAAGQPGTWRGHTDMRWKRILVLIPG